MREGPCHRILLHGRWLVVASVACAALVGFLGAPFAARALPPSGWTHDHSAAGIPHRPHGYNALVATFGQPCSAAANAARSSWPSQSTPGVDGYINYHPYIDRDVSWNIRNHISADLKEQALYPGWRVQLPLRRGTTSWSIMRSAAIDINWQRNPRGAPRGTAWELTAAITEVPAQNGRARIGPQLLLGDASAPSRPHHFQY
jgi:hypothetical protein